MSNQGRLRFWQGMSAALGGALAMAVGSSLYVTYAQPAQKPRFAEIDVERINVIEADGTVKLVIANRQRAPDQVSDGQSRPRTEANKSPGITFFDDAGDEAGGLKVRGDRRAGRSARRHLVFDQHRGDQVLGLITDENDSGRTAGMTVWDRPDAPLTELVKEFERISGMPAAERAKAEAAMDVGATRVFVGKRRNRDAVLTLADARGRERLRLVVPADGTPRIEFVDQTGKVVRSISN